MDNDPTNNRSLRDEIKKRKTQEILRSVEAKRTQSMPVTPAKTGPLNSPQKPQTGALNQPSRTSQTGPLIPPKKPQTGPLNSPQKPLTGALNQPSRTSQTGPLGQAQRRAQTGPLGQRAAQTGPLGQSQRITQSMPAVALPKARSQRRIIMMAALGILGIIIIISGAILLVPQNQANSDTGPTPVPLVSVTADEIINYLKKVGVPIANEQSFTDNTDKTFRAKDELQFDVHRGSGKATFLIMTFESQEKAGLEAFRIGYVEKFKNWGKVQFSNIVLLTAPGSTTTIEDELVSHLTQLIIAPVRSNFATATPTLAATP